MSDKLEQLYERALALAPEARASFVAEACRGDERLRAELLSLIAVGDAAESFFADLGHAVFAPPGASGETDRDSRNQSLRSPERAAQRDSLPEGSVIGHYRIVGRLGAGGMGTVYRAHDSRLDRDVALKFLSPQMSSDPDAEQRLLVEARAAAALQHPNVCVVHEIGETPDGHPFIAMALCEGETLKQRLAAGPMAPEEAVAIAAQVAHALHAAHSRQIVHRDVKPGNIILGTDGTVKLLDFGLAKPRDAAMARPGPTPGTIAYMSPEQVRGEPLDHRSDLWSLGVVVYEMVAGQRPFRGGNNRVAIQTILHDDPEPLSAVHADVPPGVAHVVHRLLHKDRDGRYASAAEVLTDLVRETRGAERNKSEAGRPAAKRRAIALAGIAVALVAFIGLAMWSRERAVTLSAVTAVGRTEPSIAVLPLVNLSTDSGDAALATGITEDLIATLARAGGVRVIASTSTSAFRDRKMDVRQIADSLGVSNILEGGIHKNGSQLRVQVRLVSARDGSTSWAETYDREFKDVLAVQEEIVRAVAAELGLRFDRQKQLGRHNTRNVAAYELYLRASDPALLRSQSGIWQAQELFEQAIAADSTYAAAHAGLALVHVRRARNASDPGMPAPKLFALAEEEARRAIELDGSLAEAHYALGRVLEATLDFPGAEAAIKRAIAIDPTRSVYHRSLAYVYGWMPERQRECHLAIRRALETDPLNPYAQLLLANVLHDNGRDDEALAHLERLSSLKPPLQGVAFAIGQHFARKAMWPEAIAALRSQAEAGDPTFAAMLGYALARAGQHEEAQRTLADLLARETHVGGGAFQVAVVYAGMRDANQTFRWLNKAVDDRSIGSLLMAFPFEELRSDPRFPLLRRRLGFRE
jgi:eukaryotic-like serine/threonine-protein kinase